MTYGLVLETKSTQKQMKINLTQSTAQEIVFFHDFMSLARPRYLRLFPHSVYIGHMTSTPLVISARNACWRQKGGVEKQQHTVGLNVSEESPKTCFEWMTWPAGVSEEKWRAHS